MLDPDTFLSGWYVWVIGGAVLSLTFGLILNRVVVPRIARAIFGSEVASAKKILSALRATLLVVILLVCAHALINAGPFSSAAAVRAELYLRVAAIASAAFVSMRLGSAFFTYYAARSDSFVGSASILLIVMRATIALIAALVALETVGISVTPVLTALGVGGLAVALGFQETLANLFGGLSILLGEKIRVNNFVRMESGQEGRVEDIGWRTTSIRKLDNSVIVVPNSVMAKSTVQTFDLGSSELAVLMEIGVAYDSDLAHVEAVTLDVADQVIAALFGPNRFPEFSPLVRFHTFGESSVNGTVVLRAPCATDQFILKHEFIKALSIRFRAEGIQIPFPVRTVHLAETERDGV